MPLATTRHIWERPTVEHVACGAVGTAITLAVLYLGFAWFVDVFSALGVLSTTALVVATVVWWVLWWLALEMLVAATAETD
ncbi:hypothetical protein [Halorarius halobius]|uniref:hypothetical protein n=1 Tax=Halorarius halobius TaxID=2962671 RepID=UPI0020CF8F03|nr:hypothetical protein [Halorarius halobius]